MPLPFYLTCLALVVSGCFAWNGRYRGWGLPMGMVLATVGAWYIGDVLYNEADVYLETIGEGSLTSAWWQVLWFLAAFSVLAPVAHQLVNHRLLGGRSHVMTYLERGHLRRREVQRRIDIMGAALLSAWVVLMAVALVRVKGDAVGLFLPFLGQKAIPWGRGQIGGGFSALISLGGYLHLFLAAAFGVLAGVALNPKTRTMALMVCALTLPYFIFDRTRNAMLATVLPGVLAYVFLQMRGGYLKKAAVLFGCFLLVNFWFSVVMANRQGMGFDIQGAMAGKTGKEEGQKARHEGLNMLEELAWIDHFIETGAYLPNNGRRYFAELANPVPRGIWKNKPTIGLDYAVARGQAAVGPSGEVTATISTGMIGQGVVNFGRVWGPLAAALLMALWVAVLARMDLLGDDPARLILYGTGLILTFNMGRDISLLVLYPFLFGWILFHGWKWWQRHQAGSDHRAAPVVQRMPERGHGRAGPPGRPICPPDLSRRSLGEAGWRFKG